MANLFSVRMNLFRIAADLSHTASKIILIWAIHSNKSAEGVSLITQMLYALVFCTRYLDLFSIPPWHSWWNFFFKTFYITTSLYIILIMTKKYARTREREKAWKFAMYIMGGSLLLTPVVAIMDKWIGHFSQPFMEVLWKFSIILESVCVLPQLLLLRQTSVPTVIDSYYLVTLGSYRAFYVFNWIYRGINNDPPDAVSVTFGVIQTAFYLDFAWVYYSRQRVKLRGGAVVDSDDLRKGFLVNRFTRGGRQSMEDELEAGEDPQQNGNARPKMNRWGARGVSIRADDTLETHDGIKSGDEERAPLKDPDQFLSDDEDDDDAPAIDPSNQPVLNGESQEWEEQQQQKR